MRRTRHSEMNAEPNLTPILDMVFQLITFFMLVINFRGAAMDLSLKLPVLGSARPLEIEGQEDHLLLNIDSEGALKVYGEPREVSTYIAAEAKRSYQMESLKNPKFKKGDNLPTTIVVRADRNTPFHLLNEVIRTCQDNGYRKFSLRTVSKQE